jgi:hypothetical protein
VRPAPGDVIKQVPPILQNGGVRPAPGGVIKQSPPIIKNGGLRPSRVSAATARG